MEETQRLFAEASVLLPQKKEIPSLLTNISALGTNSGLNMSRFQPGGERKKEFYAEIPVSLKVSGPYHNIGDFLYEVSKLDRIISAQLINLGSGKEERGELILRSTVNLVTYRFLEESEMQKPEKKGKKGKKRK
jgi:type IV pilus assembly protein PilO